MNLTKNMLVVSLLFVCMAKVDLAFGERVKFDHPKTNNNSTPPSSGQAINTSTPPAGKVIMEASSCENNSGEKTRFPQGLISDLSQDGSPLEIEFLPPNQIQLKLKNVMEVESCGKLTPIIDETSNPGLVAVSIKAVLDGNDQTFKTYTDCMKKEENQVNKKYKSYTFGPVNLKKNQDIRKTIKIVYASPADFNPDYPAPFGLDSNQALKGCMQAENVRPESDGPLYVNKGRDILLKEIQDACNSKDAQIIADAKTAIGNAAALNDIADQLRSVLDAKHIEAIKLGLSSKGKDGVFKRMEAIEEKLKKNKDTMTEKDAKKLIKEYAELAKEVNEKLLNRSIARLQDLMEASENETDEKKLEAINKEIEKLNGEIKEFSKRDGFKAMYALMEKYAITDSAKTIESIRLKSFLYGRVSNEKNDNNDNKPISLEKAGEEHKKAYKLYENRTSDWEHIAAAANGDVDPIKLTLKQREEATYKMNKRYYDFKMNEQVQMQKYCGGGMTGGMNNPVKCQEFQAGSRVREAAELRRREGDLRYIQGRNVKLDKMDTGYRKYAKEKADDDMRNGTDSSGYTEYGSDLYALYPAQTSQSYDPYNPAMYQTPGMNFQGPGYNPNMVNPQQPVYPGQYQMPMQQQWPNMR